MKHFILTIGLMMTVFMAYAQQRIEGFVLDKNTLQPVVGATISQEKGISLTITDSEGRFSININNERARIKISYIGYKTLTATPANGKRYYITPEVSELHEVVVTAREKAGPVTTSVIGREAMEHLQPTSIADLMELLPGGYAKDPNMGAANTIQLRETGSISATGQTTTTSNNYNISQLGTQFIVDGAPISADANLQYSPLGDVQAGTSGTGAEVARNITNKGIDMRSISTDDIERVEVVRGIPSVEYGNLTSGIVNIQKIRRAMPLTMRFKADGYSKLIAVGKGLSLRASGNSILNLDLGFLDSKVDPTDNLENYRRVNASARYTLRQTKSDYRWNWNAGFDYNGSFDNSKQDPDLNYGRIDEYKSSYNRMALNNTFRLVQPRRLLREVEVNTSVSLQLDHLKERRLVAPQRYGIVPTGWGDGEQEAGAVYAEYVADYLCDGKPFNAYVKAKSLLQFGPKSFTNKFKLGINWDLSKNFGDGQVYDMYRPLSLTGWSSRPRKYSDIPSLQNLSLFAEENMDASLGKAGRLEAIAGIRLNTMPGLDSRYDMSGKWYADPRLNASWHLPSFTLGEKPFATTLSAGWGLTTKNPTLNYLYPDKYYHNFVELAYYDTKNPQQDSRYVVMSYIQDPTNYQIKPARNRKWEVRLDLDWADNTFSVDYFHEQTTSGFRYSRIYDVYDYKRYDASAMSAGTDWRTLPYTTRHVLDGYTQSGNGTKMVKQGIELQFRSARIQPLLTRINISGAWFRTTYTNSQPMFDPVSTVIDNQAVSELYVGLYDWNDGRINDRLNTNVTFDTQVPEWGLVFTTSAQFMWLVRTQLQRKNGQPTHYLSADDGALHPYTESDQSDIFLGQLMRYYNDAQFDPFTVPMTMIVNLKATKKIGRYMKLSFFANKILDYLPDYESNGHVIRRNASPYFGVEANLEF